MYIQNSFQVLGVVGDEQTAKLKFRSERNYDRSEVLALEKYFRRYKWFFGDSLSVCLIL